MYIEKIKGYKVYIAFNRTTVECKSAEVRELSEKGLTFNRTTVECKCLRMSINGLSK